MVTGQPTHPLGFLDMDVHGLEVKPRGFKPRALQLCIPKRP